MRQVVVLIAGMIVLYALTPCALAFTSQPVNPTVMSNRLTDPEDITEQMSNGQSPLAKEGGVLQFSTPSPSSTNTFWGNPSTVFVPSEHR